MDPETLRELLQRVADGLVDPDEAARTLRHLPFQDLGYARIDHHRALRQGQPEVIYGPGKTPTQVAAIASELLTSGDGPVILTRSDAAQRVAIEGGEATGSTVVWRAAPSRSEHVVIASGGTADEPVVNECAATLAAYGIKADRLTDVGIAGLPRLLASVETLADADAVVVVAGMEGALATAVGGLTAAPIVAVPTSVGYGSSLEGVTALLAMLSSCAAGVAVVGIDNGFGAAAAIVRMLGPAQ